MTKVDPYLHAVLLLHGAGQEVSKDALVAVLKAAKVDADEAKAKVLAEAVKSANFEELLKNAIVATAVAPAGGHAAPAEAKKEEKKEDEGKKEEAAAEGLANLFG
ncbi:MAG: 50S ribosomal protein P1 [Candidatus Micrarchaeota archaeon]